MPFDSAQIICPLSHCVHTIPEADERPEHDELMNTWIDIDPFEAESRWAVPDNADHFNFGPDWRCVYNVLAEIAAPLSPGVEDKWIPRFRGPG